MLFHKYPFSGSSREELAYRICRTPLSIPDTFEGEEKEILKKMLIKNENDRASLKEIHEIYMDKNSFYTLENV